ncbi:MAG: hypothetical protein ACREQA_21230 [Candidatus Binatia bacterium]
MGRLSLSFLILSLGFANLRGGLVTFLGPTLFRFPHPAHHYPVYLLGEIERELISLTEAREIIGQVEFFGRIDVGADEFDLGRLSTMSQVSLPDAEAV